MYMPSSVHKSPPEDKKLEFLFKSRLIPPLGLKRCHTRDFFFTIVDLFYAVCSAEDPVPI